MQPNEHIRTRLSAELGRDVPARPVEKHARPQEIAFVDVRLCEPCGLCIDACPASCIEHLRAGTLPDRDPQPVQVRYDDCVGCGLCVEICTLIAGADAVRMYDANLVEQVFGVTIGAARPAEHPPLEPWDDYWAEEGGYRHMGIGSRLSDSLAASEREELRAARQAR
jgi:Pyruvate/2-oxoacid:ferredoxin oxidoreductase delta subunit